MLGIYIHIPFCVKKCNYCDFNSSDKINHLKKPYKEALIKEIENSEYWGGADSVFIGGGTPTSLEASDLVDIINCVSTKFQLNNAEFTVEVNPATLDEKGFKKLFDAGVNRLSFGLQSANDDELKVLGRIHTFEGFLKSYSIAQKCGFDNINVDLMFSLPDQTLQKWVGTLNAVISLAPQHISCYSLIIEEGTPFYSAKLNLPSDEDDRMIYEKTISILSKNGYNQYEISNFSREKPCLHNLKYWNRENYIGFGAGAHSLYNNTRFENMRDVSQYIYNNGRNAERFNTPFQRSYNKVQKTVLSREEIMQEYIFLALRKTEGFDIAEFNRLFNVDFKKKYSKIIEKYLGLNLLKIDERCALTLEGIHVSNTVMSEFM